MCHSERDLHAPAAFRAAVESHLRVVAGERRRGRGARRGGLRTVEFRGAAPGGARGAHGAAVVAERLAAPRYVEARRTARHGAVQPASDGHRPHHDALCPAPVLHRTPLSDRGARLLRPGGQDPRAAPLLGHAVGAERDLSCPGQNRRRRAEVRRELPSAADDDRIRALPRDGGADRGGRRALSGAHRPAVEPYGALLPRGVPRGFLLSRRHGGL